MANNRRGRSRRLNGKSMDRILILAGIFGILTFVILFCKLYQLQVVQHEELNAKALSQQTRVVSSTASRGTIYDANGEILAISGPVQNVILSPRDVLANIKVETTDEFGNPRSQTIQEAEREAKIQETYDLIADNMSEILGLDREDIMERLHKTDSAWQVLAKKVDEDVGEQVQQFIDEYDLEGSLYLTSDSKRYYPYGSLAAQVVGFVNSNNEGSYGLEALYDDSLSGEDGKTITTKNARGTEMLSPYSTYSDPQDGYNVNTTIDATIQMYAEQTLKEGIQKFDVINGGFCIVMDPKTCAVLAMASYPDFNLNDPNTVLDSIELSKIKKAKKSGDQEAYADAISQAQFKQWSNKCLNTSYEPGSTFKPMVVAAALEEGAVSDSDTFYCSGAVQLDGWTIRCSARSGHGTQTLRKAVMNSCNPAFISIGQKLGAEKFYQYWQNFGFTSTTGIELPGESQSVFWSDEQFLSPAGIVYLATASFGQRFTVSPIQLITALSAVVNGGHLMEPYVVQSLTDADGNVVSYHEPTEVRQVISEDTSALVRSYLESVVNGSGGTGKNAAVAGYRIGGKTGSSQNIDSTDHIIVSFAGIAPADDPEIVVLLAYDWPQPAVSGGNTTASGVYISGGNMAAPMAGQLMANILDYKGYQSQYDAGTGSTGVTIPNVVGGTLEEAQNAVGSLQLNYRVQGEGSVVVSQLPSAGSSVPITSTVVLTLGENVEEQVTEAIMPNLNGMSFAEAQTAMDAAGLYMNATGITETGVVFSQSVPADTPMEVGDIVEVKFVEPGLDEEAQIGE